MEAKDKQMKSLLYVMTTYKLCTVSRKNEMEGESKRVRERC